MRDKRQAAMQAKAADIIDQLTICVEAGLGFDAALARVATTTEGPLTDELRHTISDIQAGVPRAQALRTLADRAQIVEIRQLVTALLQAQKHGVPMAETLRIQSAEMRLKRKQRTEEKAAKLTVKMLFPIIVCFLPVFMIITVVPSLLDRRPRLLGVPRTTRGCGVPLSARGAGAAAPAPRALVEPVPARGPSIRHVPSISVPTAAIVDGDCAHGPAFTWRIAISVLAGPASRSTLTREFALPLVPSPRRCQAAP